MNGLRFIAGGSKFVVSESQFLEALLSGLTTEELLGCISSRAISGKYVQGPVTSEISLDGVSVEFKPILPCKLKERQVDKWFVR